jgi:hypothetical protein
MSIPQTYIVMMAKTTADDFELWLAKNREIDSFMLKIKKHYKLTW